VTGAAVVAYPTPRGARLYAFVETAAPLSEAEVRRHIATSSESLPDPSLVQIARQLPRRAEGDLRDDVLRLIAQNQIDLIHNLKLDAPARQAADDLVAERLNRTDRRLRQG
jgi:acyl-coenzyme A synthetase/AMP-(fatty) acid ligase